MENSQQHPEPAADTSQSPPPAEVTDLPNGMPPTDPETIFSAIYNYPWEQDREFQIGLASILGNTEIPDPAGAISPDPDLLLQAQCFYFARKHNITPLVDVAAYKSWLSTQPQPHSTPPTTHPTDASPTTSRSAPPQTNGIAHPPSPSTFSLPASSPTTQPPPPYPTSFAHIIDLITRNQPIPGVEEIPDTVLDASLSQPDTMARRRKPWEREEVVVVEEAGRNGAGRR